jgi:hypothetical protein
VHIVDVCVCVNSLYNDLRADAESMAALLENRVAPGDEQQELKELASSFRTSNPHVLFSRTNVQRMMTLVQLGGASYLQNKSHTFSKATKSELQGR